LSPLEGGLPKPVVRSTCLAAFLVTVSATYGLAAVPEPQDDVPDYHSTQILQKYLTAQQAHEDALRGASMQVDIDANVPGLKEHGRLHALRSISKVGSVTYHMLSFQGDNSVKKDVIARYLQAEEQGQGDQSLAITPANYKFKYKGEKTIPSGEQVFDFQLSPRSKKVGLFKGVLWLDAKTYLPVLEKGRLVKNPSIFFKKVEFERDYSILNGTAVPKRMSSTIDVRLVGKVELSINYSNFEQNGADTGEPQAAAANVQASQ
jgi:hypothetical protein